MDLVDCLDRFCDYYDHVIRWSCNVDYKDIIHIYYKDKEIGIINLGCSYYFIIGMDKNIKNDEMDYQIFLTLLKDEEVYKEIIRYDREDKINQLLNDR
jgi:hypothetical protein